MSSRDVLELQKLYVWLEKSEVALGFALLPRASGEAGPGRPAGTGAVAWDTVLAVRQWPSNQFNTTRVSSRPEAQMVAENILTDSRRGKQFGQHVHILC